MKSKTALKLLLFALAGAVCSCTAPQTQEETIQVDGETSLRAEAAGGTFTVSYTATVTGIFHRSDSGWLTVSPADGTGTMTLTVESNTEGSERQGNAFIEGGNASVQISVTQSAAPEHTINLEVKKISRTGATLSVVPDEGSLSYICACIPAEEYEKLGSEQDEADAVAGSASRQQGSGSKSLRFDGLSAGTRYTFAAFGTSPEGERSTAVFSITAETAQEFAAEFIISDIKSRSVMVEVIPDDDRALYWWDIAESDATDGELKAMIEELAQVYVSFGAAPDIKTAIIQNLALRGASKNKYEDIYAGTEFTAFALVFDEEGNYDGAPVRSEPFRTLDPVTADVSISLHYGEYFDGDEVSLYFPQFSDAAGQVLLPVSVTTEGEVESYWYSIFSGDLTDSAQYSDNLVISNLLARGKTEPKSIFRLSYDKQVTIFAAARDAEGNYGPIVRETFSLAKGGESPAENLSNYL